MLEKVHRRSEVLRIFGFGGKSTLDDQIRRGDFPKPDVQISERCTGWSEGILLKEQERRKALCSAQRTDRAA